MLVPVDKVIVREGSLTLPTYEITGENRNPVFRSQYGVAHIYPYTLLDEIAAKPSDKTYNTVELENRYLRVTVIPDLGGRVYSVYDKISEREVFYKNSIIKFSPLAIRGAFFSGGVEFSFPVAHAPTTTDAVNWDIKENPDGSASVAFGGLEHISGLRWMIKLTLFPDRCILAQDVHLYNPSFLPGRYHYWTNASLDANDQTEFIYPLRRARSYEYAGTASWPFARLDLVLKNPGLPGMEGVPMWPANRLQQPVNFRWQKNMLAQVSIFGRNVEWDFFGAWQHSVNHGYAHFAKARDVSGMKLWSWGNAPVGVVNQTALTDDGSVYAETQCGAMETQLDFAFLQPGKVRSWREWWLPLRGLGGLTCASDEIGANIRLVPIDGHKIAVHLAICPTRPVSDASICLAILGKALIQVTTDLAPETPWLTAFQTDPKELANHAITLTVQDAEGKTLIDYTLDKEPGSVQQEPPQSPDPMLSADSYYQLGLRHENFDNREQAKDAYRQALAVDPEHPKANYQYGLMLFRSEELDAAWIHLQTSANQGEAAARYFLGVLAMQQRKSEQAESIFQSFEANDSYYSDALVGLGCLALQKSEWSRATGYFQQACAAAEAPISESLLAGIALRREGRTDEASAELLSTLAITPLNHPALREIALALGEAGQSYQDKLDRLLADDPQYVLDLACFYDRVGLPGDAVDVLKEFPVDRLGAMPFYLGGYLSAKAGKSQDSSQWFARGTQATLELGFPSRLEEIQALKLALQQNPQDYHAMYFLANFYYAHERYEEAVQLWEKALEGIPEYGVLLRNLGLAYWQRERDLAKAVAFFEKALGLNPKNYDLYLHLDDLYKAQALPEKRASLLARIQALDEPREDVRKRKVAILVDLGRYEEALHIMTSEQFVPLEMDQSFHDLYARAWMQSAEAHLGSGQVEAAISDYQKALEYPDNLGVGKPTTMSQAEIFYKLGCAYELMGNYSEGLAAWQSAAKEHHPYGDALFEFVQKALDKLSRYSELGLE